ncbi:hypothetical protein [Lentibacillus saliphilus]|uniref:hypothetical protein n=1 Tax=Lentibacillus saliphilus TaxID=2737028 RepID=UPI001C304455|nr:hypothetical protein [Lentibacillus saliphilus]
MKIRVGAIGPRDSVERVMAFGRTYDDLDIKPFIYDSTEDTADIIQTCHDRVDQWFFSGPVPYDYALQNGLIQPHEGIYATLHGSSLLGVLLEAVMRKQKMIHSISLDSIDDTQLDVIKTCPGLDQMTIHQYDKTGYIPSDHLVLFHETCYKQQKTDIAVTCINSVYHKLKEKNIPVFRVVPSELSVRLAIDYLRQRAQKLSYRKKQLVMIGFEVIYPSTIEDGFIPYKIQHSELELHHVLLQVAEKVHGSLAKIGNGKYIIYTTRGDVDFYQTEHSIEDLAEHIRVQSNLGVRIGIGYGQTVLEADEHVHIAFDYARQDDRHNLIVVNEEKEVIELRDQSENILYQQRFSHEKWGETFEDLKVSAAQAKRVYTLAQHHEKDEITAQELANWLQSTERNARRILQELERAKLAKVVGEESGQRGRPRRVYQLLDVF